MSLSWSTLCFAAKLLVTISVSQKIFEKSYYSDGRNNSTNRRVIGREILTIFDVVFEGFV
jgi:hypothetical protein